MQGQVTSAEWLRAGKGEAIQWLAGRWGLCSQTLPLSLQRDLCCFQGNLSAPEWKLDLPSSSGVEMECNPRTSQWGCSFPAAAFCSHTTNTLIDVDVVLKRSTFLFDAGKQLHTPSLWLLAESLHVSRACRDRKIPEWEPVLPAQQRVFCSVRLACFHGRTEELFESKEPYFSPRPLTPDWCVFTVFLLFLKKERIERR